MSEQNAPAEDEYNELMAALDEYRLSIYYSRYRDEFSEEHIKGFRELFTRLQRASAAYVQAKTVKPPVEPETPMF